MRFSFMLALLVVFQLSARDTAAQVRVSLELEDATLRQFFSDIRRQTGNTFIYSSSDIDVERKVDVRAQCEELTALLDRVLAEYDLGYSIDENYIVVFNSHRQQPAAQRVVEGTVTAPDGSPLVGAAVLVKGTTTGVSTDMQGHFSLRVPAGPGTVIEVRYVGMETVEVPYEGQVRIDVRMKEAALGMETLVVTGIFNKARESYTGAATTISREELKFAGNSNLLSLIQNIDPSFQLAEDLLAGSDPNSLPNITIRGNSSLDASLSDVQADTRNRSNLPLFILDGFEITLERMLDLDRNIVESITLLKDASSTAMYGTRGANGVVVITTRRPEGGHLRVTYKGDLSIETPQLNSYNLMNAREKLAFEVAAGLYESTSIPNLLPFQELYNSRLADVERGVDTYWLKYPVRTGVSHRHSLRFEGGDEKLLYSANVSYENHKGAMKGSYRNNFNGDVLLMYTHRNISFRNDLIVGFNRSANSPYGKFSEYAALNSYWKPYNDDGELVKILSTQNYNTTLGGYGDDNTWIAENPLWNASQPSLDNSKYNQIQNNTELNWNIIPGDLVLRGRFSYTHRNSRSDIYNSAEHTKFASYTGSRAGERGEYILGTGSSATMETAVSLNYTKTFNNVHQLYAGVSGNFADSKSDLTTVKAIGITNPNLDFIGAATLYEQGGKPVATESWVRRLGVTANVNYTYDRRYFLDVTGTVEGSSMYGADNRTAPFWSAGAGWNMHAEKFMEATPAINVARLRFSYGTSGSQNFSPYQALTSYQTYGDTHYNNWYGSYLLGRGNADLGWQKTNTVNAGFDLEMFQRRVNVSADFYIKTTNDALADITLPLAAGFNTYKANIGTIENRGFELNLNLVLIRDQERRIRWSVGGTMAMNTNKIKKISNALELLNQTMLDSDKTNPSFLFKEGESINTIYAVRSLGIDPSSGKELYLDLYGNVTDKWSAGDKIACGVTDPKIFGVFNTTLSWRDLTLTMIFNYRSGGKLYNQTLAGRVENISPYQNADRRAYYDRWSREGQSAMFKGIRDRTATEASSRFVMKNNYIECKNISLHYQFESPWLRKNLGVSYLELGAYTEDLFRIGSIRQERGTDYPFSRKYSLSLTLRF